MAPDLIFTVGGMQAAMPSGIQIGDVLNAILGDATGTFFDRRAKNRASMIVTQQCVAVMLQQLRCPQWTALEMGSDDAMGLGKLGMEAIKRRKTTPLTEAGVAADNAADAA